MTKRLRFCALAVALTCALPLSMASVGARAAAASTQTWLQLVNHIRTDSGLPAVTEDPAVEAGIRAHLTYLAKTPAKYFVGMYANHHLENPSSPYHTTAGALEGAHSDLASGTASDLGAIDTWLTAPFHAIGMLRAGLTQVGFARDAKTGDAGIDVITGDSGGTSSQPILYPRHATTLTRFGGESPDPTQTCTASPSDAQANAGGGAATGGAGKSGWGSPASSPTPGMPLIALLPAAPVAGLTATLTGPQGATVSSAGNNLCVVDSQTFYTTDSVYGPAGQQIFDGDNAVLVIPRLPLVKGAYTVDISQPGQPDLSWSFASHPVAMPPGLLARFALCSWSRGHSGIVAVGITNTADSTPSASYAVTVKGKTLRSKRLADGKSGDVLISGLPAGRFGVSVAGSDGTHGTTTVVIPACPTWAAAQVEFGPPSLARHRVPIYLGNTRNRTTATFSILTSPHHVAKYRVKGGKHKIVTATVYKVHKTTVTIKVGTHKIASETFTLG